MTSKTRSFVLPIVSATATAFLAWGCGRDYPRQICVGVADIRVDDANCRRSDARYHWYYYPSGGGGAGVAGIGSRAIGGSYARSAGTTFYSAPAEGVTRGGFGSIGGHGGGEGGGE
jgi:hypothetical protein